MKFSEQNKKLLLEIKEGQDIVIYDELDNNKRKKTKEETNKLIEKYEIGLEWSFNDNRRKKKSVTITHSE